MKVFAHRGASALAPENTMAAIELALTMPLDGIEIDVYPIENDYIVIHDRWLTRTTGIAKRVDQVSLEDIRKLSAGIFNGEQQSIPLLSEVLALPWGKKCLNIELKHLVDSRHFLKYLKLNINSNSHLTEDNILISSFNHHYLKAIQKISTDYKLGWLTASNYLSYAQQAEQQKCFSINVDIDVIDQEMVKSAHALGLQIYVFTADALDDVNWLHSINVDGVFTNQPDKVCEFIQSINNSL